MGQSTEVFAARRLVKPESVISRLCRTGSYFGVRPVKLENGRLLWPDDDPEAAKGALLPTEKAARDHTAGRR